MNIKEDLNILIDDSMQVKYRVHDKVRSVTLVEGASVLLVVTSHCYDKCVLVNVFRNIRHMKLIESWLKSDLYKLGLSHSEDGYRWWFVDKEYAEFHTSNLTHFIINKVRSYAHSYLMYKGKQ